MQLLIALFGLIAIHQVSAMACQLLRSSWAPNRNRTTAVPDTNFDPPTCPNGQFCYDYGTLETSVFGCYEPAPCQSPPPDVWLTKTSNLPGGRTDPPLCHNDDEICVNDGTSDNCYKYSYQTSTNRPYTQAPTRDCVRVFWPMTPASVIAEADPLTGACPEHTHCEEGRTTDGQQGLFCIGNGYIDPNRLTVPWYFV